MMMEVIGCKTHDRTNRGEKTPVGNNCGRNTNRPLRVCHALRGGADGMHVHATPGSRFLEGHVARVWCVGVSFGGKFWREVLATCCSRGAFDDSLGFGVSAGSFGGKNTFKVSAHHRSLFGHLHGSGHEVCERRILRAGLAAAGCHNGVAAVWMRCSVWRLA